MPATLLHDLNGLSLLGAGTAFAEHTLSNEDVLLRMGNKYANEQRRQFVAQGATENIGVRSRTWSHLVGLPSTANEETSADLGARAARAALRDAGVQANEIGLLIVSTSSPHRMTGTSSGAVHAALGLQSAAMDVRTGCAGGLFALTTAALYAQAGAGPILLVGAETFSKVIPHLHSTPMMSLGDGAGALVLGRRDGAGIHSAFLKSDGSLSHLVATKGPLPPQADALAAGEYFLSGDPDGLAAQLPGKYLEAIGSVRAHTRVSIDLFVPHQTSRPLILSIANQIGWPIEQTFINVERHANIGVAGWMVALAEAREEQRVQQGSTVLLAAVGGGMSWAAVSWTL